LASGGLGFSSVLPAADPKMPPPGLLAGALPPLDPELPGLEPNGEVGRCGPEEDEPEDSDDEPPPNGLVGRG